MDFGEQLTALENHIYVFAKTQFELNGIPPTISRMVMESVYCKFQDQAIAQIIANQVSIECGESKEEKKTGSVMDVMKDFYKSGFHPEKSDPEKVTQSEESIQETVEALKDFYGKKEGENGRTESSSAQA